MSRPLPPLLQALLGPGLPEVSCETCFAELDRYVEAEHDGADADAVVPGMRAHLLGCPACAEEHRSLAALLRADAAPGEPGPGLTPPQQRGSRPPG